MGAYETSIESLSDTHYLLPPTFWKPFWTVFQAFRRYFHVPPGSAKIGIDRSTPLDSWHWLRKSRSRTRHPKSQTFFHLASAAFWTAPGHGTHFRSTSPVRKCCHRYTACLSFHLGAISLTQKDGGGQSPFSLFRRERCKLMSPVCQYLLGGSGRTDRRDIHRSSVASGKVVTLPVA